MVLLRLAKTPAHSERSRGGYGDIVLSRQFEVLSMSSYA
jgi:hypothetical protein